MHPILRPALHLVAGLALACSCLPARAAERDDGTDALQPKVAGYAVQVHVFGLTAPSVEISISSTTAGTATRTANADGVQADAFVATGETYTASISAQPAAQLCTVLQPSGTGNDGDTVVVQVSPAAASPLAARSAGWPTAPRWSCAIPTPFL